MTDLYSNSGMEKPIYIEFLSGPDGTSALFKFSVVSKHDDMYECDVNIKLGVLSVSISSVFFDFQTYGLLSKISHSLLDFSNEGIVDIDSSFFLGCKSARDSDFGICAMEWDSPYPIVLGNKLDEDSGTKIIMQGLRLKRDHSK